MTEVASPSNVFLSAEWRDLIFLNYIVPPELLRPFVPAGTTLGSFQGKTYMSLVGFRFCKTKLWGKLFVPFHSEFEEVNLRFYVHREVRGELRRGVVFIKEIVPKPAIALTARWVYGENYVNLPMNHSIAKAQDAIEAKYSWKFRGEEYSLAARTAATTVLPAQGSLEQYITEHFWGYSRQKSGGTMEYRVDHASWPVSIATEASFGGDAQALYGSQFSDVLRCTPDSAYFAPGSYVEVFRGRPLAG